MSDHHRAVLDWYERVVGHPAVTTADPAGVLRFAASPLACWLLGHAGRGVLNDMAAAFRKGEFSVAEYATFYAATGYSVGGFADVFAGYIWPTTASEGKTNE